jgi:hypothetical protein
MQCPKCHKGMTSGRVSVQGTVLGFLFFGVSHQQLWWSGTTRSDREKILGSGCSTTAHRCEGCKTVVITQ